MKEFLLSLKWCLIFQAICWGCFIVFDEIGIFDEFTALILGIIVLIGFLIYYFIYSNKYLIKNNLKVLKFDIIIFIFWIVMTIGMTYFTIYLVDIGYLHYCGEGGWDCFLNGIEYLLYGVCVILLPVVIIFIKIIIWTYKFINKKLNKKKIFFFFCLQILVFMII